jgi:hypothetical protein
MKNTPFKIIAPVFKLPPHSEAEAFGSVTLLWMHGANLSARYVYRRSHERGVIVRTFTGERVDPACARQWWADRPMLAAPRATTLQT